MSEYNKLASEYVGIADFLTIYTEETHPEDGWYFDGGLNIKQHINLQERIQAANVLKGKGVEGNLVCDDMSNESTLAYAAKPERLYVLLDNKVVFVGGMGPNDYNVDSLRDFLLTYLKRA